MIVLLIFQYFFLIIQFKLHKVLIRFVFRLNADYVQQFGFIKVISRLRKSMQNVETKYFKRTQLGAQLSVVSNF